MSANIHPCSTFILPFNNFFCKHGWQPDSQIWMSLGLNNNWGDWVFFSLPSAFAVWMNSLMKRSFRQTKVVCLSWGAQQLHMLYIESYCTALYENVICTATHKHTAVETAVLYFDMFFFQLFFPGSAWWMPCAPSVKRQDHHLVVPVFMNEKQPLIVFFPDITGVTWPNDRKTVNISLNK